jgi:hypothetical protein
MQECASKMFVLVMSLLMHKTSQTIDDKIPEEETDWGPATRGRSRDSGLYVYCCPHLRQLMGTLLKKSQDRISVGSIRRKSQSKTCYFLCQPVRHLAPLGTHIHSNWGQNECANSVFFMSLKSTGGNFFTSPQFRFSRVVRASDCKFICSTASYNTVESVGCT